MTTTTTTMIGIRHLAARDEYRHYAGADDADDEGDDVDDDVNDADGKDGHHDSASLLPILPLPPVGTEQCREIQCGRLKWKWSAHWAAC